MRSRLDFNRPAHQAGAGPDAGFVRFEDSTVHLRALAEIIAVCDQLFEVDLLNSQISHQFSEHGLGAKVFFRDRPSRAPVLLVIRVDRLKRC